MMALHFRRFLLSLILSLAPVFVLSAGEIPATLETIRTEIDGNTRRTALLRELRLSEGLEFANEEDLRRVVSIRLRNLEDRRLFEEFETTLIETSPGFFQLDIRVVDASTFVPAPMIVYSSDLGIMLGGTFAYRNAFGTMTDQLLLGYWSPARTYVTARVGNIAVGPTTLEVKFEQELGVNRFGNPTGDVVLKYDDMKTTVSLLVEIPLGLDSPWSYWAEPIASFRYGYEFEYNTSTSLDVGTLEYRGFAPGLNHGFSFSSVERIINFRRGVLIGIENANLWYPGDSRVDSFLETDLIGLVPATDWLEFSGRIGGFYAFSGLRRDAGDRLRGTKDYMTYGTSGIFATGQVNFRTFRSRSGFEIHLRPFADIGYIRSSEWDDGPDAMEYNAGSSFIFYFPALPSLSLNFDFGWDFKRNDLEVIVGFQSFI